MVAKDVKRWNRKPVLKDAKGKSKTVVGESAANPQRGRLDARRLEHCILEAKSFLRRGPHQLSRFSKFSAELSSGSTSDKLQVTTKLPPPKTKTRSAGIGV